MLVEEDYAADEDEYFNYSDNLALKTSFKRSISFDKIYILFSASLYLVSNYLY